MDTPGRGMDLGKGDGSTDGSSWEKGGDLKQGCEVIMWMGIPERPFRLWEEEGRLEGVKQEAGNLGKKRGI